MIVLNWRWTLFLICDECWLLTIKQILWRLSKFSDDIFNFEGCNNFKSFCVNIRIWLDHNSWLMYARVFVRLCHLRLFLWCNHIFLVLKHVFNFMTHALMFVIATTESSILLKSHSASYIESALSLNFTQIMIFISRDHNETFKTELIIWSEINI